MREESPVQPSVPGAAAFGERVRGGGRPVDARAAERAAGELRGDVQAVVIRVTTLERGREHRRDTEARKQLREVVGDVVRVRPELLIVRIESEEARDARAE